jgi:hypothetical protein
MSTEEQGPEGQPSEEELRAALEEQMKRITVEDVILQTVVTLVNLAGRRLTVEGEQDIEQARLGIEAVRALLPLCPQDQVGPIKDALSQLQMLFAQASGQPQQEQKVEPAPEPEKPASKLWTPGSE